MNIFHEIYGTYFRITGKLLGMEKVTKETVNRLILNEGFRDSMLFLPQKLIPQKDGTDWGFFTERADGTLEPVIKHPPKRILTLLQKRWLAAKLSDPKMRLFLDEDTISEIRSGLGDVKPLYGAGTFRYTDRFIDGDDYASEDYIRSFRAIVSSIRTQRMMRIRFRTDKGSVLSYRCRPVELEYSLKNDKFRLRCRTMSRGKLSGSAIINLGSIISAEQLDEAAPFGVQDKKRRAAEPAVVKVTDERGGVERFMTEFAAYEKRTVRDPETGVCTTELMYDKADETELLIQLLSFGPVLEIVGPPRLRSLAAERVKRQYELLFK